MLPLYVHGTMVPGTWYQGTIPITMKTQKSNIEQVQEISSSHTGTGSTTGTLVPAGW